MRPTSLARRRKTAPQPACHVMLISRWPNMASRGPDEGSAATRRERPRLKITSRRPRRSGHPATARDFGFTPLVVGGICQAGYLKDPGFWVHHIFYGWDFDLAEVNIYIIIKDQPGGIPPGPRKNNPLPRLLRGQGGSAGATSLPLASAAFRAASAINKFKELWPMR